VLVPPSVLRFTYIPALVSVDSKFKRKLSENLHKPVDGKVNIPLLWLIPVPAFAYPVLEGGLAHAVIIALVV
tara:strand:+ start:1091 stop:1306 length:216 start_codon:yes stop_codon:yes gene_type:complete